jgi:hypothetical protein
MHFATRASTARLETYRRSFWAVKGRTATLTIRYLPIKGQTAGDPYLTFQIPASGLRTGTGGTSLRTGDSVLVTLSLDSLTFAVEFQPGGVTFNPSAPATLQLWFTHANPDLNGDGVVDDADQLVWPQLGIWCRAADARPWQRLTSQLNLTQQWVLTALYHFSGYAVAW